MLDSRYRASWWWLGAHGGAGASTLTTTYAAHGGRDAGRAWPLPTPGEQPFRVVLVARTDYRGLTAAQSAARQWASGGVPGVTLLGLVLIADAPGKLPKPLAELAQLVCGGVPRCWRLPWIDELRLGHGPTHEHPALAPLTAALPLLAPTTNGTRDDA